MLRRNWLKSFIEEAQESRLFGGSFGGDTDVTSRVEPWSEAKRHFTKLYGLAEAAYGETNTDPYPGEFIAGENGFDRLARNQVNFAQEQMAPDAVQVRRLGAQIVTGYFLDPSKNTTLVNSIDVAIEKAESALLEDVIPRVLDVAVQSGAYSGTGTELMVDRALEGFSREALRATTGIYYENWTRERGAQGSGVEMLRVAETMEFERSKLIQLQLEDLDIQNSIAKFEDELKSHWRGQQEYMSIMTGGGFHADTSSDPSKKKNVLGSALQGAVGGASLGASVGGGPGAIVGGILGGVAGLLG
jgi:hypothetical protein